MFVVCTFVPGDVATKTSYSLKLPTRVQSLQPHLILGDEKRRSHWLTRAHVISAWRSGSRCLERNFPGRHEQKFCQTQGFHAFQHVLALRPRHVEKATFTHSRFFAPYSAIVCENKFSVPSMLLVFSGSVASPVGSPMLPNYSRVSANSRDV
jgi:hypothetical protein